MSPERGSSATIAPSRRPRPPYASRSMTAPRDRAPCVVARVIRRRPLRQRREHGALGERQVLHVLSEQVEARRLDAIHAITEVDDVEIELEDLVLCERPLDQAREPQLDQL